MKTSVITRTQFVTEEERLNNLQDLMEIISQKLDSEVAAKQKTIDLQEKEIVRLQILLEEKNTLILQINDKLSECAANSEGSRQLINKLLNDIERLNQDIAWYKRTYEKRSLLGTIKQKIFNKKH